MPLPLILLVWSVLADDDRPPLRIVENLGSDHRNEQTIIVKKPENLNVRAMRWGRPFGKPVPTAGPATVVLAPICPGGGVFPCLVLANAKQSQGPWWVRGGSRRGAASQRLTVEERGEGGGSGTQNFVYQKMAQSDFPDCKFRVFHNDHFDLWGGGGPGGMGAPPMVVGCSNVRLASHPFAQTEVTRPQAAPLVLLSDAPLSTRTSGWGWGGGGVKTSLHFVAAAC